MKALAHTITPLAVALLLGGAATRADGQRRDAPKAGGVSLLLEVKAEGPRAPGAVERTAEVIRRRCARLGVRCELSPRAGGVANRLALRFSPAKDAERVRNVLLSKGFELRAVVSPPYPGRMLWYATRADAEAVAAEGADVFPLLEPGLPLTYIVTEREPIIDGDVLRNPVVVRARRDTPGGGYVVDCRLDRRGSARLSGWMAARLGSYAAVVLDGWALSAVYVKAPVSYNVVVSGGFDRRQAEDAAAALAGGRLPAPVEVLEETAHAP
jgi:preprotein translocase subunit SecD